MAETVTGNVKDLTGTIYPASRNPELWFDPSGTAVGDAIYFPSPVRATLDTNTGAFTVDLVSYEETLNRFFYLPRVVVNNGPDHTVTKDFPEFPLFVPFGGGVFRDLIEIGPPPGSVVYGYGPPPDDLVGVIYVDISGVKPVLYA